MIYLSLHLFIFQMHTTDTCIFVLYLCVTSWALLGWPVVVVGQIGDTNTTLGCHIISYTLSINKTMHREDGEILYCYDNNVQVHSCWGRCDSQEVGSIRESISCNTAVAVLRFCLANQTLSLFFCVFFVSIFYFHIGLCLVELSTIQHSSDSIIYAFTL